MSPLGVVARNLWASLWVGRMGMSMSSFRVFTELRLAALVGVLGAPGVAKAQVPPTPAVETPCVPTCRSGFLCHQGQCLSLCNPPCPAGETCSASGECARSAPAQSGSDGPPPVSPGQPAASTSSSDSARPTESATESRKAENALYVELLGPGLLYSVNYNRAFGDVAARVGVGYLSSGGGTFLAIPLTISYLGLGSKRHMFELGAGVTIYYVNADSGMFYAGSSGASAATVVATGILGYRFQPPNGGFSLRVGLSPLISQNGFLPWPHLGLGATF